MSSSLHKIDLTQMSKSSRVSNKARQKPLGNSQATNKANDTPIPPSRREADPRQCLKQAWELEKQKHEARLQKAALRKGKHHQPHDENAVNQAPHTLLNKESGRPRKSAGDPKPVRHPRSVECEVEEEEEEDGEGWEEEVEEEEEGEGDTPCSKQHIKAMTDAFQSDAEEDQAGNDSHMRSSMHSDQDFSIPQVAGLKHKSSVLTQSSDTLSSTSAPVHSSDPSPSPENENDGTNCEDAEDQGPPTKC
ncbi:hypothetical protein M422DRAFT_252954 [Sphaerobolus stellatus SS14]|uniref:Uncharacterized protein n=1 Tax=Sphaerobolus stellatus (strain SS14) TaxID=990650 RepID=A0A0C9VXQ9_SPHS4|nr:hypothetical protein M422DRAFT_252954 [Sphaerobolus stellatus SS14]